jgi:prepilin-type N-terminal cleavage/methylation domain-containing protein
MNKRGLTLIELLIVLVISSILIAGIYRTFIQQQHTYTVQEQVVDMQQSLRIAINQMVREIRMAGFGRTDGEIFNNGGVEGYKNVITPADSSITIVASIEQVGTVMEHAGSDSKSIKVTNASSFDALKKGYISINGTESHRIHSIAGDQINFHDMGKSEFGKLKEAHFPGEPVFMVQAITYSHWQDGNGKWWLMRDENLGEGPQPVAENVEFLQFTYTLADGTVFVGTVPPNREEEIRLVQVTITVMTDRPDPELGGGGDGKRRRTLTSNIQLRNLSSL